MRRLLITLALLLLVAHMQNTPDSTGTCEYLALVEIKVYML